MIIRKITIMHQRLMQSHERVRAAWMPDPALRRIPMMTNPDMRLEILQPVIPYNIIPKTHELQHDHVLSMGDHEGLLFAQRRVILLIQSVRILVEKFIFYLVFLEPLKTIPTSKLCKNIFSDLYEIANSSENDERSCLLSMRSEEHTSELQSRFDLVCR